MKKIGIMGLPNGVGISRDIEIIAEVLRKAGHFVESHHMFRVAPEKDKYDLCIYLERMAPGTFGMGKLNVFIPNQEWFETEWLQFLPFFDKVLAKTRFAEKIFKEIGCNTEYISFTSKDRFLPEVKKDDYHWIHIAGKSIQKQTEVVIRTWERNPGFPSLSVIQDPKFFKARTTPRNVNLINDRYPDEVLQTMQNSFSVHVCPSETEGFGHYIMEALSVKALVITTDAAPMNEIITPERGLLVKPVGSRPMRLSTAYMIDEKGLEETVVKAMILTDKRSEYGERGRQFFLDNDLIFRDLFTKAINNLLQT
jgi:hypothetical protein